MADAGQVEGGDRIGGVHAQRDGVEPFGLGQVVVLGRLGGVFEDLLAVRHGVAEVQRELAVEGQQTAAGLVDKASPWRPHEASGREAPAAAAQGQRRVDDGIQVDTLAQQAGHLAGAADVAEGEVAVDILEHVEQRQIFGLDRVQLGVGRDLGQREAAWLRHRRRRQPHQAAERPLAEQLRCGAAGPVGKAASGAAVGDHQMGGAG